MASIPQSPRAALLNQLQGVREAGQGRWVAKCPSHEDGSPSLAVRELDDGRLLIHCFAGCDVSDVVTAVGLSLADLFPQDLARTTHRRERRPFDPLQILMAVSHEALTVAILADEIKRNGGASAADYDRLRVASERVFRGMWAVGELPESPENRALRRGAPLAVVVK